MSKINDLISALCPSGVPFKRMGDIGSFYGGLSGKSKEDFKDGNAVFITYMNVYSNIELKTDVEDRVRISENEKQNTVQYGDVLFTGSSETPDECGMSSVLTTRTDKNLYLNSFCFGYRFTDPDMFLPGFTKHLFRSEGLRYQITRTASGVTRYNVSKKKMEDVTIPVPPIEVQREIVKILDNFTELIAKLSAELSARKQQYEFYRNQMIETQEDAPLVKLGNFATVSRGGNFQKKDFVESGYPCIHYGQMYTHFGVFANDVIKYLSEDEYNKARHAVQNDIVMAVTSENVEDVCSCTAWLGEEEIAVSGHTAIIHHNQNAKYLSYYFHTDHFYKQKAKLAHGTKVIEVTPKSLVNILVPLPNMEEQQRIVSMLDRFDELCYDDSTGLPAEIEARILQYEYYRDKFMVFNKK